VNTLQQELDRIRTVYAAYDQSGKVQRRWDPGNPGNREMERERARRIDALLHRSGRFPAPGDSVLEIGCGKGDVLATMVELGVPETAISGVDLLPDRIATARRRFPAAHLECADAGQLPFIDHSFSLVLLFTVVSSLRSPKMCHALAGEAARVLRPGGAVLWYDLRLPNPYNAEVRAVRRDELRRLFPGFRQELASVTVLPPLARRLGHQAARFYPRLAALPWLRTHWLGLLVKPATEGSDLHA